MPPEYFDRTAKSDTCNYIMQMSPMFGRHQSVVAVMHHANWSPWSLFFTIDTSRLVQLHSRHLARVRRIADICFPASRAIVGSSGYRRNIYVAVGRRRESRFARGAWKTVRQRGWFMCVVRRACRMTAASHWVVTDGLSPGGQLAAAGR